MVRSDNGKGVVFDMDGVLIDTGEFHKQAWCDLAKMEGWDLSDEFFYNTFGMQNYQIIPLITGKDMTRSEIDRSADWKEQRYRELIAGQLTLLEGVRELIDDLKLSGFRLAIGTSTPRVNLEFMLANIAVRDRFDDRPAGRH